MKITLGLAVCAALACGLAASADTAQKPRYKQNGDLCTAEEIANPPVVSVRYGVSVARMKVLCKTKAEWSFARANESDKQRARDRGQFDRMNGLGQSSSEAVTIQQSLQ